MKRALLFGPLLVFVVLAVLLYAGFSLNDPHKLPSALLDKAFPDFDLPSLLGTQRVTRTDLLGKPRLVNVWATWCPTCLQEHDTLNRIARESGVSIVGVNYRDDTAKAVAWLRAYGNPYELTIVDATGDLGVDLGVYGAPETFLVDADGVIRFKHIGDVNDDVWKRQLAPVLAGLSDG